jgi:hypothetical protein
MIMHRLMLLECLHVVTLPISNVTTYSSRLYDPLDVTWTRK